jgi:hypothetical protein
LTREGLYAEQPAIYFVQSGFETVQIVTLDYKSIFSSSMGAYTAPEWIILALRLFTAQPMISVIQAARCLCFSPTMGNGNNTQL